MASFPAVGGNLPKRAAWPQQPSKFRLVVMRDQQTAYPPWWRPS